MYTIRAVLWLFSIASEWVSSGRFAEIYSSNEIALFSSHSSGHVLLFLLHLLARLHLQQIVESLWSMGLFHVVQGLRPRSSFAPRWRTHHDCFVSLKRWDLDAQTWRPRWKPLEPPYQPLAPSTLFSAERKASLVHPSIAWPSPD